MALRSKCLCTPASGPGVAVTENVKSPEGTMRCRRSNVGCVKRVISCVDQLFGLRVPLDNAMETKPSISKSVVVSLPGALGTEANVRTVLSQAA